jgi:hypothetical protein
VSKLTDRGINVNREVSQMSSEGIVPAERCRCCAILQSVANPNRGEGTPYVIEAANDQAVVLSGPELTGLLVLPRQCVGGIEELSPVHRAEVLAAVRLATRLVREGHLGADSRIVVMNDSTKAAGHVRFEVVPDVGMNSATSPHIFTDSLHRF